MTLPPRKHMWGSLCSSCLLNETYCRLATPLTSDSMCASLAFNFSSPIQTKLRLPLAIHTQCSSTDLVFFCFVSFVRNLEGNRQMQHTNWCVQVNSKCRDINKANFWDLSQDWWKVMCSSCFCASKDICKQKTLAKWGRILTILMVLKTKFWLLLISGKEGKLPIFRKHLFRKVWAKMCMPEPQDLPLILRIAKAAKLKSEKL